MPPKKGKNGYKKRKYNKKKKAVKKFYNLPSGRPMPNNNVIKMRYCDTLTMTTAAAGAISAYRWKANGCTDPATDIAGTHRPRGWLQTSAYFKRYVVIGAKFTARINTASGVTKPTHVGAMLAGLTTGGADPIPTIYTKGQSVMEAKKGSFRMIPPDSNNTYTVKSYYSAKNFFNIKDIKDKSGDLGALCSTDPTTKATFYLWCENLAAAAVVTLYAQVTIDYIIMFQDPLDVQEDGTIP